MSKKSITKEKWIAKDGSIYTDAAYRQINTNDDRIAFFARKSIAFNIGSKLAEYIVQLHNSQLSTNVQNEQENQGTASSSQPPCEQLEATGSDSVA